ncbi:hypothetical protein DFP72DRAFT_857113 [Ephemerocybe angulata]|uniref:Uncharacterized protein n=1 Tax=Ephemerocybe angulata TaxID=980116 RepID=A0A8H6HD11_9AGAR|nr:hypothetical protein DFP72DRAFT_857113 [Tulosesus angulatus]
MRVSFINLLTALGALASLANAYHDDYTFAARDNLDELTTSMRSLDRREILADIATRDLLAEVTDRLEARSRDQDPYPPFRCLFQHCGATFPGTKEGQILWTSTLRSASDEHLPMQAPVITTLVLSAAHACLDGGVPNCLRERCGDSEFAVIPAGSALILDWFTISLTVVDGFTASTMIIGDQSRREQLWSNLSVQESLSSGAGGCYSSSSTSPRRCNEASRFFAVTPRSTPAPTATPSTTLSSTPAAASTRRTDRTRPSAAGGSLAPATLKPLELVASRILGQYALLLQPPEVQSFAPELVAGISG